MFSSIYYKLLSWIVKILKGDVNIVLIGEENLPDGACIIASNHLQVFDSIAIYSIMKSPVHFFAAKWLYKKRVTKNLPLRLIENLTGGSFLGLALRITRQIPVENGNRKLNQQAFLRAKRYLKRKHYIGIYPSGQFEEGKREKAQYGVAKLAIENEVLVVPLFVDYPEIGNREELRPKYEKIEIRIGKPIQHKFKKGRKKKEQYRELTEEIIKEIDNLK